MSAPFASLLEGWYRALWRAIVVVLRVPDAPPALPVDSAAVQTFRPSAGFLRYLKLWFWIAALAIDALLLAAWLAILIAVPPLGLILLIPFLAVSVVPDIVGYVAVHLRFDSTWYVVSDRSMRLRRGIWFIRETTITFENIQDIAISQGPVQRAFGIADVVVKTAGGGGGHHQHQGQGHLGLLEGLENAKEIRDLILARITVSRSAGLGDESQAARAPFPGTAPLSAWTPEHLQALRQIRDLAANLA